MKDEDFTSPLQKILVRTGSGPGSPAGQPGWGGGSDRVIEDQELSNLLARWIVADVPASLDQSVLASFRKQLNATTVSE